MSASAASDQSTVCFGDRVLLSSALYFGFLHTHALKGDGSPPKLVVHANQTVLKQIEDQKEGRHPVSNTVLSIRRLPHIERAVLEIVKPNQSMSASLVYGQRVKLRHVFSDLFLSLKTMHWGTAAEEISLEARADQRSQQLFRILPKYSKIRVEGECVRDCDQVIFQHVDTESILTANRKGGTITLTAPKRAVPFSREMRQEEEMWSLHIFHKIPSVHRGHKVSADVPEEPKPIKIGSIVSLQHVESDGFVSIKPKKLDKPTWISALPVYLPTWDGAGASNEGMCFVEKKSDPSQEFSSYASLWVIEGADVHKGGLVTLHKQHSKDPAYYFRLRHLQTGKYLATEERNGRTILTSVVYNKNQVIRFLPDSRYGDCGNSVIGGHTLVRVVFDSPKKLFMHVRKNNEVTLSDVMIYDDLFVVRPVSKCGYYYGDTAAASDALRRFTSISPRKVVMAIEEGEEVEDYVSEWCNVLKSVKERSQDSIIAANEVASKENEPSKESELLHRQSLLLDNQLHILCFVSLLWCRNVMLTLSGIDEYGLGHSTSFVSRLVDIRTYCYQLLTQLCHKPRHAKLQGPAPAALAPWLPFVCFLVGDDKPNSSDNSQGLRLMMEILRDQPEVVRSISVQDARVSLENLLPCTEEGESMPFHDTRRIALLTCLCVCKGESVQHHQEFICNMLQRSADALLYRTRWCNGKIQVHKPSFGTSHWTNLSVFMTREDEDEVAYFASTRELLFSLAYKNQDCASFVRECVGISEALEGVVLPESSCDYESEGTDTDSEAFGCFERQKYPKHMYLDPLRAAYVRLVRAAYIDDMRAPPRYNARSTVLATGSVTGMYKKSKTRPEEKTPEVIACLSELLSGVPLLRCMAGSALSSVVGKLSLEAIPMQFVKGTYVAGMPDDEDLWIVTHGEIVQYKNSKKDNTRITAPVVLGQQNLIKDISKQDEKYLATSDIRGYQISTSAVFAALRACVHDIEETDEMMPFFNLESDPMCDEAWPWQRLVLIKGLMTALERFLTENKELDTKDTARNVLLTEWLQLLTSFIDLGLYTSVEERSRLAGLLPLLSCILDLSTDVSGSLNDTTTAYTFPHPLADNDASQDFNESFRSPLGTASLRSLSISKSSIDPFQLKGKWSLVRNRILSAPQVGGAPVASPRSPRGMGSPRASVSVMSSVRSARAHSLGSPRAGGPSFTSPKADFQSQEMLSVEHAIVTRVKLQVCRIFVKLLKNKDNFVMNSLDSEDDAKLVQKLKDILLNVMKIKGSRELFVTAFRVYLMINKISTEEDIPQGLVHHLREDLVNTNYWCILRKEVKEGDAEDGDDSLLSRIVRHCTTFSHVSEPGCPVPREEENEIIIAALQCLQSVLMTEADTDRYGTLSERQNVLNDLGAIEIIINTVDSSARTDQQEEVVKWGLDLAISLLEGGNNVLQDGLKHYFFSRSDETLFLVLRDRITKATSTIEKRVDAVECGALSTAACPLSPSFQGPLFHIEETMRFLQLCCEGHNTALQNYFRIQEDNVQSHDLVSETLKFLKALYSIATVRAEMSEFLLKVGIQTWRTLAEFCQGPVRANQATLIEGGLGDDVNNMFKLQLDDEGGLVTESKNEAVVCMLSVLEGCTRPHEPLVLREALETELLLSSLEEINEESREDVELGFNVYLLLDLLSDYDKYGTLGLGEQLDPANHSNEKLAEALVFYKLRTAHVEIMRESGIESVYFRKPSIALLLSRRSRKQVMEHVCWDTRQSRLVDFFDSVELTMYHLSLIGRTEQDERLWLHNTVHKWSTSIRWSGHALVFLCNMLLLFDGSRSANGQNSFISYALMLLTFALLVLNFVSFLEFAWLDGPVLTFAKDRKKKRQAGKYSVADYVNMSPSIDSVGPVDNWRNVDTSLASVIRVCWRQPTFLRLLLGMVACTLAMLATPFFLSILLLPLVTESPVIRHVFRAVTKNGKSLLLTMVFGITLMYLFAVVGFLLFQDMFDNKDACSSMLSCFVFIVNYGLRSGGGVGELITPPGWGSSLYGVRVSYDMMFYIIINVILMNMVFGIIVDTFGELRQQREKKELEMRTSCFICDVPYSEFDKRADGFANHIRRDHNMWDYMFFVGYLASKTREDFTGQESYVFNCLIKNDFKFVPLKTALMLEQTKKEVPDAVLTESRHDVFSNSKDELELLGDKLDTLEQKVASQCKTLEDNINNLAREVRVGMEKRSPGMQELGLPRADTQTMYETGGRSSFIEEPSSISIHSRRPPKVSRPLSSPTVPPDSADFGNTAIFGDNMSFLNPVHSHCNASFGSFPRGDLLASESPTSPNRPKPAEPSMLCEACAICALAGCLLVPSIRTKKHDPVDSFPDHPQVIVQSPSMPNSAGSTPADVLLPARMKPSIPLLPLPTLCSSPGMGLNDSGSNVLSIQIPDETRVPEAINIPGASSPQESFDEPELEVPSPEEPSLSQELSVKDLDASCGSEQSRNSLSPRSETHTALNSMKYKLCDSVAKKAQNIKTIEAEKEEIEGKVDSILEQFRSLRNRQLPLQQPPAPSHRASRPVSFRHSNNSSIPLPRLTASPHSLDFTPQTLSSHKVAARQHVSPRTPYSPYASRESPSASVIPVSSAPSTGLLNGRLKSIDKARLRTTRIQS